MGVKERKHYGNKAYWLKQYWPARADCRASDINNLRSARCDKERITANPPSRAALAIALLDLAWIRQALRERGDYGSANRANKGSRCPLRIG